MKSCHEQVDGAEFVVVLERFLQVPEGQLLELWPTRIGWLLSENRRAELVGTFEQRVRQKLLRIDLVVVVEPLLEGALAQLHDAAQIGRTAGAESGFGGGIEIGLSLTVSARDAAAFLMAGASAVQVGTATLRDPARPAALTRELAAFGAARGLRRIAELIASLEGLRAAPPDGAEEACDGRGTP